MIIFIIGPGGAGKTTSGKILAEKLNYNFVDLDDRFMEEVGDIGKYIADFGYEKYCFRNSELFYSKIKTIKGNLVFVVSSGFLAHEGLDNLTEKHKNDLQKLGITVMLLPSSDLIQCQDIIIKRQLGRGFGLREDREKEKIQSRFLVYKNQGDIKIFSNDHPEEIADLMKGELNKIF